GWEAAGGGAEAGAGEADAAASDAAGACGPAPGSRHASGSGRRHLLAVGRGLSGDGAGAVAGEQAVVPGAGILGAGRSPPPDRRGRQPVGADPGRAGAGGSLCEGGESGAGEEGRVVGSPVPRASSEEPAGGEGGPPLCPPQLSQASRRGSGDRPAQLGAVVCGLEAAAPAAVTAATGGPGAHLAGPGGVAARGRTARSRRVAAAAAVALPRR